MALYNYRYDDFGAPTLDGQAGSLLAVIGAILADGYNQITLNPSDVNASGFTVFVFYPGHGFRSGQMINISGEDTGEYNMLSTEVSVTDVDNFQYDVLSPPSYTPAVSSGSMTAKVASIGSGGVQFGTNETTFALGFHLAVDDTGTTEARVRGFSTTSSPGVAEASGSDPFPLDTSVSGGLYVMKSVTADGTPRPWYAYSTGSYIHLVVEVDTGVAVRYGFGSFVSAISGDVANFAIEANESAAIETNPDTHKLSATATAGIYTLFDADGTTAAGNPGRSSMLTYGGALMGGSGASYPTLNGGLLMDRVYLFDPDPTVGPRGIIPGLWNPLHERPLTHLDTFSGASPVSREFEYFDGNSTNPSSFVLETSQTWINNIGNP